MSKKQDGGTEDVQDAVVRDAAGVRDGLRNLRHGVAEQPALVRRQVHGPGEGTSGAEVAPVESWTASDVPDGQAAHFLP